MKTLKEYLLFEVSEETAKKAEKLAIADIKKLSDEFAISKFNDMDILVKLQKRARQVDVFKDYAEKTNDQTAEGFSSEVNKVIEKWNKGKKLSNDAIFKPLFVMTSGEKFEWGKARGWGKQEWNDHIDELEMIYLTVIGLNSEFENEKRAMNKVGADISSVLAVEKEYNDINDELKNDLSKIKGLEYQTLNVNRKNSKNPYNTIVMIFKIDKKIINLDKISELLPGTAYTNQGAVKTDRSRGYDSKGSYQALYRSKERKQSLN